MPFLGCLGKGIRVSEDAELEHPIRAAPENHALGAMTQECRETGLGNQTASQDSTASLGKGDEEVGKKGWGGLFQNFGEILFGGGQRLLLS